MRYHFNQTSTNALASHRRIVGRLFASTLLEVTSVSVSLGTNTTTLSKLVKVSITFHDNINFVCEKFSFHRCGLRSQIMITVRFMAFSLYYVDARRLKLIFKFHLEKVLKRTNWRKVSFVKWFYALMRLKWSLWRRARYGNAGL